MKTVILFLSMLFSTNVFSQFVLAPSRGVLFEPVTCYATNNGGFISLKKAISIAKGKRNLNIYRYYLVLTIYDAKMTLVKEQRILNGEEDYSAFYADLKESGSKFWLICTEPGENNEVGNIKSIEINPATLALGTIKTLATQSQINESLRIGMDLERRRITVESSPDLKHHLLFISDGKSEFFLSSLDEEFKPLWQKKYSFDDGKEDDIKGMCIDNQGNIFIGKVEKDAAIISKYDTDGKLTSKALILGEQQAADVQILTDGETGKVYASGAYTQGSDYAAGVYKAELNVSSLTLENVVKAQLPDSIVTRLKKDGFANTGSKKFGIFIRYFTTKLFCKPNENLSLVIECKHELATARSIGVGSLVIANFNKSGISFAHVPRYAVGIGNTTSDHYYGIVCKQQLVLFYLDAEANITRELSEAQAVLKNESNGILTAAVIESNCALVRTAVISNNDNALWEKANLFLISNCRK